MSFTQQGKPARIRSVYGHNFIHVVNGGSSTNTVEVEWYVDADSYTSHFLKGKSINASDYVSFPNIDLVLQPGDKIQVTPTSAGHIDTILTVTETFVPVG